MNVVGAGRERMDVVGKGLTPYSLGQQRGRETPSMCFLCNKKEHVKANCRHNLLNKN